MVGVLLQLSAGPVMWQALSFPVNLGLLVVLLVLILLLHLLEHKVYAFGFLRTFIAAVPALVIAALLTVCMGLIKQQPDGAAPVDCMGFTRMTSSWPFVLIYLYLVLILGLAILHRARTFHLRDLPFMLNHLGLFVVLVAAALGSADTRKLTMNITRDMPEWQAVDAQGRVVEMPVALQLIDFNIEEYPPKLMLIDNRTGHEIPRGKPLTLTVDEKFHSGTLGGWTFTLVKRIENSAPTSTRDTTYYVPWNSTGAMCALYVTARNEQTQQGGARKLLEKSGWVTCGSYLFPYQTLVLDDNVSLVMADREPRSFVSKVQALTRDGQNVISTIEVNKPLSLNGWKIYQLNYDTSRGKWSEVSVLQLVKDPWLPAVYAGILMLAVGAVWIIFSAHKRKEDEK